jgi:hypothetical protein
VKNGFCSPKLNGISMPSLFQQLQKAPRSEIVAEIDHQLEELNSQIADFRKPHHALYAQLLMQALVNREQRHQARIMVWCTVIIAVLTAAITWVTIFK